VIALISQVWPPIVGVFLAGLCLLVAGLALHRAGRRAPAVPPPPSIQMPTVEVTRCPACRVKVLKNGSHIAPHFLAWTSTLCDGSGEVAT
jgi:hypothetical protein